MLRFTTFGFPYSKNYLTIVTTGFPCSNQFVKNPFLKNIYVDVSPTIPSVPKPVCHR